MVWQPPPKRQQRWKRWHPQSPRRPIAPRRARLSACVKNANANVKKQVWGVHSECGFSVYFCLHLCSYTHVDYYPHSWGGRPQPTHLQSRRTSHPRCSSIKGTQGEKGHQWAQQCWRSTTNSTAFWYGIVCVCVFVCLCVSGWGAC